MHPDPPKTLQLLNLAGQGDRAAEQLLMERLGSELHVLAEHLLQNRARSATLQPTALVNEAWMRFARREELAFDNRKAFLGFASRVMRNLLVDEARARKAGKRGGDALQVSLHADRLEGTAPEVELLDLEQALERLEQDDPESVKIVELRFFGGLNHVEIADVLGWSLRRVERRWQFARAWLHAALDDDSEPT